MSVFSSRKKPTSSFSSMIRDVNVVSASQSFSSDSIKRHCVVEDIFVLFQNVEGRRENFNYSTVRCSRTEEPSGRTIERG
mmetsp:Transcript_11576/g.13442  ORF Transcript_11576/g.13442 Transcript_11576/m.13442 type:complete len:80 (-) Transcript_11576:205-444(-)